MTLLEAIILGLVQGLTEFLPVSSSGHLVAMKYYLGVKDMELAFDVLLHIGTLLAVFFVFWQDILQLIRASFALLWDIVRGKSLSLVFYEDPYKKFVFLIFMGAIPTALIGIQFGDVFERLFESVYVVGVALLVTGVLLIIAERFTYNRKGIEEMTFLDAIFIGIIQGFAIIPGISRAGSTIVAGLIRGLSRETAARFSFILSIPVILGAGLLEGKDLLEPTVESSITLGPAIAGTLVAALSGVFAIKILLKILNTGKLYYFSFYVWALGIFIILQQTFFK